jgi:hypothetical protein
MVEVVPQGRIKLREIQMRNRLSGYDPPCMDRYGVQNFFVAAWGTASKAFESCSRKKRLLIPKDRSLFFLLADHWRIKRQV